MSLTKRCKLWRIVCGLTLIWPTALTSAQENDPQRPPAVKTEEVPAVPPEMFAKLTQYQSTRRASFRGWAPDGTGILINTCLGNSLQLHRVYEPGGRREQVTFYNEPVGGEFVDNRGRKASEGELLLICLDTGGTENDQIYLMNRKTRSVSQLTDGKSKHVIGPQRSDGSQFLFTGNQRNGRDMDLYLVDTRAGASPKMIFQVDRQSWNPVDWSRDGKTVLMYRYVSANEAYPALLDVASGVVTEVPLPGAERVGLGPLAFSPDGRSVYMATDAGGEFRRLARFDLATQKYTWLTNDLNWDVSDLDVEPTTGDVVFALNEDGASRMFLLPDGDHTQRRELKLPLGIVSSIDFSRDGKQIGFTLSLPNAPSDAHSLRLSDGQLTRWTHSEIGGLAPANFVMPRRIKYKSFDGRMIPTYYYASRKASADKKVPVYIGIHGGPEGQYRPYFSSIIQYFVNELGIAVIYPNVRGSDGYGKTYLQLDNGERREDAVKDIGALLDWIGEQPELDSNRVAVAGGSYGGYMVLASLTHYGERIKAGIDYVGIANFITFLERTAPYRVALRRAEYGDERDPKMRAMFERISPLNNAEKIRAALMVVHGKNDPRVPFYEAQQITTKVRRQGRPVWAVFAENEGHDFTKADNDDYARAVEVMFLRQHLSVK